MLNFQQEIRILIDNYKIKFCSMKFNFKQFIDAFVYLLFEPKNVAYFTYKIV